MKNYQAILKVFFAAIGERFRSACIGGNDPSVDPVRGAQFPTVQYPEKNYRRVRLLIVHEGADPGLIFQVMQVDQ